MQTKYIEVNDIKPAAIILTQCVLQFLQPGNDSRIAPVALSAIHRSVVYSIQAL
jgi:hypothetical protein